MKKAYHILVTVCIVVMSYAIVNLNIKMKHYIEEYNKTYDAYKELVQQYDSTTTYNKMVIYPKIKDMEEKLK